MLKRHEAELRNALDPLAFGKHITLSRRQFRYWIGAQRLSVNGWATLIDHLPEEVDAKNLSVIEDEDVILIFFNEKMTRLA